MIEKKPFPYRCDQAMMRFGGAGFMSASRTKRAIQRRFGRKVAESFYKNRLRRMKIVRILLGRLIRKHRHDPIAIEAFAIAKGYQGEYSRKFDNFRDARHYVNLNVGSGCFHYWSFTTIERHEKRILEIKS